MPKKIIALGVGKTSSDLIQKLNSATLEKLKNLKKIISEWIAQYLNSKEKLSFDVQKIVSEHLNLVEHIEFIKNDIQFLSIDLKVRLINGFLKCIFYFIKT